MDWINKARYQKDLKEFKDKPPSLRGDAKYVPNRVDQLVEAIGEFIDNDMVDFFDHYNRLKYLHEKVDDPAIAYQLVPAKDRQRTFDRDMKTFKKHVTDIAQVYAPLRKMAKKYLADNTILNEMPGVSRYGAPFGQIFGLVTDRKTVAEDFKDKLEAADIDEDHLNDFVDYDEHLAVAESFWNMHTGYKFKPPKQKEKKEKKEVKRPPPIDPMLLEMLEEDTPASPELTALMPAPVAPMEPLDLELQYAGPGPFLPALPHHAALQPEHEFALEYAD